MHSEMSASGKLDGIVADANQNLGVGSSGISEIKGAVHRDGRPMRSGRWGLVRKI